MSPFPSIRRFAAGAAAAAILLASAVAGADPSAADRAAADALFAEGRRLLAEGKIAEACAKLDASQKLDPGAGTLLNLGDCQEKNGQTASAWGTFNRVISVAAKNGDTARGDEARRRAGLLEPQLSRLEVTMDAAEQPSGADVRMDGRSLGAALVGSAIPVDPGEHTIEVGAPGRQTWKTTVKVEAKAGVTKVTVPALAALPSPPSAPPPVEERGWSTQRTVGIAVGGVGVVGVVIGAVFGGKTLAKAGDAKGHCTAALNQCDATGLTLEHDAQGTANVSNAAFAIGGAALVAGVVIFATAPSGAAKAKGVGARLTLMPSGVSLRGEW